MLERKGKDDVTVRQMLCEPSGFIYRTTADHGRVWFGKAWDVAELEMSQRGFYRNLQPFDYITDSVSLTEGFEASDNASQMKYQEFRMKWTNCDLTIFK